VRTGPATIELKHAPGRLLRYNLKLSGQTVWAPQIRDSDWGQMATDFTFTLQGKTLRPDGSCTYNLLGEALRSGGETWKGRIDVAATREKAKVKVKGVPTLTNRKSFLTKPMTITLGHRGAIRFGTGLVPLAIYMIPHVDHRFWTALTLTPEEMVVPGDEWSDEAWTAFPGATGKPLNVKIKWKVLGWEKYGKQDVIAIGLAAKLDLADTVVTLKNGDKVHIVKGLYAAEGKALWDPELGVLCSATAQQTIRATADLPSPRALRSDAKCSLNLLGMQSP